MGKSLEPLWAAVFVLGEDGEIVDGVYSEDFQPDPDEHSWWSEDEDGETFFDTNGNRWHHHLSGAE
jgi:hypothetical protein